MVAFKKNKVEQHKLYISGMKEKMSLQILQTSTDKSEGILRR